MNDVLHMLLGAALVCLGVLAAAYADRVRQLRVNRQAAPSRETVRPARKDPATAVALMSRPATSINPEAEDVIAALQCAGYKKSLATQAALSCTAHEQLSPETWMTAALRRCAQGGAV
jgi:hypothetical protein